MINFQSDLLPKIHHGNKLIAFKKTKFGSLKSFIYKAELEDRSQDLKCKGIWNSSQLSPSAGNPIKKDATLLQTIEDVINKKLKQESLLIQTVEPRTNRKKGRQSFKEKSEKKSNLRLGPNKFMNKSEMMEFYATQEQYKKGIFLKGKHLDEKDQEIVGNTSINWKKKAMSMHKTGNFFQPNNSINVRRVKKHK